MKWFILWILLIVVICLVTGCTALDNITAGNRSKVVCIAQETWGGKIVAEMVSASQMLPNLTLCFGKTNTYYCTIPTNTPPALVAAAAEHLKASNSTVSATAEGFTSKKE